jgi:hypothetical protein
MTPAETKKLLEKQVAKQLKKSLIKRITKKLHGLKHFYY